jgi:hypothetical protein
LPAGIFPFHRARNHYIWSGMLRMPVIHTPPPVYAPVAWQQNATSVDKYGQADYAAPPDLIWHGDQTSAVRYFEEVEPDPLQHEPALLPSPFSPFFGFMRRVACTLLLGSFLTLSGCKWLDKSTEKNTGTTNAAAMRALPDDALFIGKSRTVRLGPNRELSRRLREKLQAEAYHAARELIAKDVRAKVKAAYPNDCHFGKFTFGFKMAWDHLYYSQETIRVLKSGTRLVRIVCKTTWKTGWCKRRYSGNRAKGISGSRIPYETPNPALR